jgi:glycosyltransferase involved in cell wall biosynthesis
MSRVIGICAVYRQHQFAGGAYSFTENLLRGMAELRRALPPEERFDATIFLGSDGIPWSDDQFTFRKIADPLGRWPVETRVGLFDSRGFAGVLFPNTFTPPMIGAERAVTVIHDLSYRNLPEHWPAGKRAWMRACHEVTLRRCDAVVAISQWVKDDILKHYGDRWESRVHAIWNPISIERFNSPAEQTFTNGRPYILCTAADRPPKNLSTLIRAFAKIRHRFPEHCLVLAGQLRSDYKSWHQRAGEVVSRLPPAVDLVKDLNLSDDIVLTGFVPDEQLGALYRGAALFVLPSLFEGFGMTAAEAIAMGAPTLVSDLPVLREVTFGQANYVADPRNEDQMGDQIAQILALGDTARPPAALQNEVRQRFAPKTIASQYLKLLLGDSWRA